MRVGIESGGNWRLRLAWSLTEAGLDFREFPGHYTARERRRPRGGGRSDPRDALAIARVVAREGSLPPIRRDDPDRQLKLIVDYRRTLLVERTCTIDRLYRDLAMLEMHDPPGTLRHPRGLTSTAKTLRVRHRPQAEIARRRLTRITAIHDEVTDLDRQLAALVRTSQATLTELLGISTINAAHILGEVGDITRLPSRDALAAANGTAPIPASSGNTTRMRLSRPGNRRLSYAIYQMALTQISHPGPGRECYQRRRASGDGTPHALRALKRRLSNVLYRQLLADAGHIQEAPQG